jgi:hypothetical protein
MRVLLFLLLPVLVAAQSIDTMWTHQVYATTEIGMMSLTTDIHADNAGNVYTCGASDFLTSDNVDMVAVRYNEWGDTIWVRSVDGTAANDDGDQADALAVDAAGNVYIAGRTDGSLTDLDATVAKFDSSGALQWTFRSGWEDDDVLYDVTLGPAGEVYACGTRYDTLKLLYGYLVMRLNPATGATLWTRSYILDTLADSDCRLGERMRGIDMYPDYFDDWDDWENCAAALAISPPDGRLVVTGYGLHRTRNYQVWTMKFDSAGTLIWERDDGRTTQDLDDAAFDLAVSDSGNIYTAGLEERNNGYDFSVMYLSGAGGFVQRRSANGGADDNEWATSICLDDSTPQNVYATGFLQTSLTIPYRDVLTHKFSSTLDYRWGTGGAVFSATYDDIGYDICHAAGRIYVAGETSWSASGPTDMRLMCYTTANNPIKLALWQRTQDFPPTPSCEVATSVMAIDNNHIYVGTQTYPDWPGVVSRSQMHAARFFYRDRDAKLGEIFAPVGRVTYLDTIVPRVSVINDGNERLTFRTALFIDPAYHDTVTITHLLPGDTVVAVFDTWIAQPLDTHAVRCTLRLAYDNDPFNNLLTDTVVVISHDVGCTRITAPTGMVDSGQSVVPQAWIQNYGASAETFDVMMRIGTAYRDTVSVSSLAPFDSVLRSFGSWTALERGALVVGCSTMLTTDVDSTNDLAVGSTFVRVLDAATAAILAPTGTIDSGAAVVPSARITNRGNAMISFNVRYDIIQTDGPDPGGVRIAVGAGRKPGGGGGLDDYSDTQLVSNLGPGETRDINFTQWDAAGRGLFSTRCSTRLTADMANANDRATGLVTLRVADMGAAAILVPGGTYSPNTVVLPRVTWHNYGTTVADFTGWVLLHDPALNRVYSEQVNVTGLLSGRDTTITFAVPCTLVSLGMWRARCSTYMAGDMHPANDHIDQFFNVRENPDVGVTAIIAPVGRVDTGAVVTPQARVRNFGDVTASFRAWFIITAPADSEVYRDYFDVMSLLPGAELTMSFPDWGGTTERGRYTSSCTLAIDDVNPANDTASRARLGRGQTGAERADGQAGEAGRFGRLYAGRHGPALCDQGLQDDRILRVQHAHQFLGFTGPGSTRAGRPAPGQGCEVVLGCRALHLPDQGLQHGRVLALRRAARYLGAADERAARTERQEGQGRHGHGMGGQGRHRLGLPAEGLPDRLLQVRRGAGQLGAVAERASRDQVQVGQGLLVELRR